jgi:hypothetical protein
MEEDFFIDCQEWLLYLFKLRDVERVARHGANGTPRSRGLREMQLEHEGDQIFMGSQRMLNFIDSRDKLFHIKVNKIARKLFFLDKKCWFYHKLWPIIFLILQSNQTLANTNGVVVSEPT